MYRNKRQTKPVINFSTEWGYPLSKIGVSEPIRGLRFFSQREKLSKIAISSPVIGSWILDSNLGQLMFGLLPAQCTMAGHWAIYPLISITCGQHYSAATVRTDDTVEPCQIIDHYNEYSFEAGVHLICFNCHGLISHYAAWWVCVPKNGNWFITKKKIKDKCAA